MKITIIFQIKWQNITFSIYRISTGFFIRKMTTNFISVKEFLSTKSFIFWKKRDAKHNNVLNKYELCPGKKNLPVCTFSKFFHNEHSKHDCVSRVLALSATKTFLFLVILKKYFVKKITFSNFDSIDWVCLILHR